jgi:hypothetical protein
MEWLTLGPLRTVLGAGHLTVLDPYGIQCSPHDMVANPREILYTTTANKDDGVFLQIVSDTWDISGYFNSTC